MGVESRRGTPISVMRSPGMNPASSAGDSARAPSTVQPPSLVDTGVKDLKQAGAGTWEG